MTNTVIWHEDVLSGSTPVPEGFVYDRGLKIYCAENQIALVEDYSSCKATKPLGPNPFIESDN